MGLRKYFSKRRFARTPEPKGKVASRHKKLSFVVQKHRASQLHYDFRLELDGVLKSWAVPKGPSLDPHARHLAIMVEDHPYEYRKFEGTIPEGNYGAGEVIIWDRGTYKPREQTDEPEKAIRKGIKKGHLTFVLDGEKLKGEFALIKLHTKEEDAWLLVKKEDDFASEEDITKEDESVVSGKAVEELSTKPDLESYPRSKMPHAITPMLATLVDEPFSREGWLFEMKWDGFRAIGTRHKDEVELYSRNGLDFIPKYPEIGEALRTLKHEVVLDGEIVIVDKDGRPHFEALQNWKGSKEGTLVYYVFDILWCDGRDVQTMPLRQRKQLLKSVLPTKKSLFVFSDDVETEGKKLFAEVERHGLEGVVAKKADSPYRPGVRGQEWLKIKTHQRQEVVIGGFTEGRGTRKYIGALLLGVYDHDELIFVGHANAGLPDKERAELRQKLDTLEQDNPPFNEVLKPNAIVHWVTPKLVGEVSFSEWTKEDMMRQPVFEGLRPDKKPKDVHREKAKHTTKAASKVETKTPKADAGKVALTHLNKTFWPERGYTKGDLIHYYETVSEYMLPYLKDRAHSLHRQPSGYKDRGFFQKDTTPLHLPSFAHTTTVHSDSTNEDVRYLVCKNAETLLYMAQLGCIEINPWSSRVNAPTKPDWGVMDLDPEGVTFKDVVTVAKTVHEVCEEWHVPHYPKTSGKTGIHIFIPMGAKYSYEQVKNFVHLIALEVNKRQPKLTSLERLPEKRRHRVYLDYLQNNEGQTLASVYSVRPTKDATVSMPLHWDEVNPRLTPEKFTIKNAPKRIQEADGLWKPVIGKGIDLKKILDQLS